MTMTFEDAITQLVSEASTAELLTIPGVWECVSEHYNNDAIKLMENSKEDDDTTLYVTVEYDLNYHGGDYNGVGRTALIPEDGTDDSNIGERFQQVTGYGPEHIITYNLDELVNADGEYVDDFEDD